MTNVPEVSGGLPEVVLDTGIHGVLRGHHQGGMVAHLPQVLQSLGGGGEGREEGGEGRGGEGRGGESRLTFAI